MQRVLTLGEADWIAQRFHNQAKALAPNHLFPLNEYMGWAEESDQHKALLIDVMQHLFEVDNSNRLVLSDNYQTKRETNV